MAPRTPAPRTLLLLLLSMLLPPPGACGEVCVASRGGTPAPDFCPDFCCGACDAQYCCSDVLKKLVWNEEACAGPETRWVHLCVPGWVRRARASSGETDLPLRPLRPLTRVAGTGERLWEPQF
nr:protein shisa-5 [Oryctolagus cuniculus]